MTKGRTASKGLVMLRNAAGVSPSTQSRFEAISQSSAQSVCSTAVTSGT